jgi:hypothetical protein
VVAQLVVLVELWNIGIHDGWSSVSFFLFLFLAIEFENGGSVLNQQSNL